MQKKSKGGSILLIAVIFTIILGTIVGSILKWGLTELKINEHHFTFLEAQNATESILQYAMADLMKRRESATNFDTNELAPTNNPVTTSSFFSTLFNNTSIVTSSGELIGGTIPSSTWIYIDPNDKGNQFDPQKGKRILARNFQLLAKTTANN